MPEAEIVPEDFSTTLLSMYFALAREGKLDTEQPRIYFAPARNESCGWSELFALDRMAEVWMCRGLTKTLEGLGVPLTEDLRQTYGQLKPDIWVQDNNHAIIIENKDGGPRSEHEREYLMFLHESALNRRKTAFLYCVPHQWLPNWEQSEWWMFVRDRESDDRVIRGIIAWDPQFAKFLCEALCVPHWFQDKLPSRVSEGRYLNDGEHFWAA